MSKRWRQSKAKLFYKTPRNLSTLLDSDGKVPKVLIIFYSSPIYERFSKRWKFKDFLTIAIYFKKDPAVALSDFKCPSRTPKIEHPVYYPHKRPVLSFHNTMHLSRLLLFLFDADQRKDTHSFLNWRSIKGLQSRFWNWIPCGTPHHGHTVVRFNEWQDKSILLLKNEPSNTIAAPTIHLQQFAFGWIISVWDPLPRSSPKW